MSKTIWGGKKISKIIQDAEQKQIKLNEFFTESQQVVGKINSAVAEVSSQAEHVKNTVSNIDETQSSVQQIKSEVEGLKEATNKLVETNKALAEEIKNQLGIAAGASLSHTFNDRKSVLEGSTKKWFRWLIADIIILFFVALFVFLELKSNPALTPNFFLKFTLSFPFIYAAFFFHGQFNKEKQLLEEYAFKAAVSLSLEAYRQLLADEFDESDDKTKKVEFMTGVINKIYTSPRESIASHPDKEESIEIDVLDKVLNMVKGVIK